MTVALVGSSSFEPGSPLVRELAARWGDVRALGIRGASLHRLLDAAPFGEVTARDVVVYVPGGNGVPDPAEVGAFDMLCWAHGARSVRWALPPRFPAGTPAAELADRTAAAVSSASRAGGLVGAARIRLRPEHVAPDGVHLTASGARALAASWGSSPGSPSVAGTGILLALCVAAWRSLTS